MDALVPLGEDEQALVGHLDDLMHGRTGSNGVQVGSLGRVLARIPLGHHKDGLFFAERLDELNGAFASHRQRQHSMRKKHGVAHGQDRNRAPHNCLFSSSFPAFRRLGMNYTYKIVWH